MASATSPTPTPSKDKVNKALAFVQMCTEEQVSVVQQIIDGDIVIIENTRLRSMEKNEKKILHFREVMKKYKPKEPAADNGKDLFKISFKTKLKEKTKEEAKALANKAWQKMNGDEKETWYERAGNDIKTFMDQLEVWWEILGEQEGWLQQAYYR